MLDTGYTNDAECVVTTRKNMEMENVSNYARYSQGLLPMVNTTSTNRYSENLNAWNGQESFEANKRDSIVSNGMRPKSRIIMGSTLLRMRNRDSDSNIIHDIVTEKYVSALEYYLQRSYKRRISRESSDTGYEMKSDHSSKTCSSVCTPYSISSECRFKFLLSTDDMNKDTSVSSGNFDVGSCYSDEYDCKEFLRNALGDEINNLTQELMDLQESNNSLMHAPNSPDIRTLSTNASYHNLISQQTDCLSSTENSSGFSETDSCDTKNKQKEAVIMDNLQNDLAVQNLIFFQISKALQFCRTTKEFIWSKEHVQAEKLLLVALCTKEALISEINRIESDNSESNLKDLQCYGSVRIENIIFPSKQSESEGHRDFIQYFVIVLTCGRTVLSTDVLSLNENRELVVDNCFTFNALPANFKISLELYTMKVGNKPKPQRRHSLFQLRAGKHKKCPSLKTIFRPQKDSDKLKVFNELTNIKPSSFTLCGRCDMGISDICRGKSFKMHNVPLSGSLSGTFTANITSKIHLENSLAGFLTLGTDSGETSAILWNRRWCVLEGSKFSYWNYPTEEDSSPIRVFDLSDCVQKVDYVDRKLCARSKTLLMVIESQGSVRRQLISADTAVEINKWKDELNYVINGLTMWHSNQP